MGVPNKKLKKLLMITGITLGVYAGFAYLLPLVIPFLFSLVLAKFLYPGARAVRRRIPVPMGIIGGIMLLLYGLIIGFFGYLAIGKLFRELTLLLDSLPELISEAEQMLGRWCRQVELYFHLQTDCLMDFIRYHAQRLVNEIGNYSMPYLMGNSVTVIKFTVQVIIFVVVTFFGAVLAVQEWEQIRAYVGKSRFREEYLGMKKILGVIGRAYGKSQLIILMLTIGICIAGLYLMKNPYFLLLGTVIGLLDALPFVGTGIVFIPWTIVCFLQGQGKNGFFLLFIYLICYFLRQYLESKVMGNEAGLSPFTALVALYVGVQLFGLAGVILGPLGLLIIREAVDV